MISATCAPMHRTYLKGLSGKEKNGRRVVCRIGVAKTVGLRFFSLLTAATAATGCMAQVDRFAVPMASLARESEAWEVPSLEGQRIFEGSEVVLSKREFRRGIPLVADTQEFRLISVVVPMIEGSHEFDVEKDGIRVAYSRGNSALPGGSCFAYATSGRIEIQTLGEERVQVKFSVKTGQQVQGFTGDLCREQSISDEGVYRTLSLRDLSPWLGAAFTHPHDASFR